MSDEARPPAAPATPQEVVIREANFPEGHNFPDEILSQWISIPYDEPVVIGPLTRQVLDNLLFSTTDTSAAIASLSASQR
jgi:hypothetical protein